MLTRGDSSAKGSDRTPVFLSALVCPGLGQLAQRRWAAGLLFAAAFLLCFAAFMAGSVMILVRFYSFGLNFMSAKRPDLPIAWWAAAFVLSLLVYLLNILDAQRATQRARREAARRRIDEAVRRLVPPPPPGGASRP